MSTNVSEHREKNPNELGISDIVATKITYNWSIIFWLAVC